MRRRTSGFTLIELLVTMAIIGVLIALLLPAIQMARESARASKCKANLNQIGVALHNYHEQREMFPPGWVSNGKGKNPTNCWGWSALILPKLDQRAIYDKINFDNGFDGGLLNGANSASGVNGVEVTVISIYKCPSDIGDDLVISGTGGANPTMTYGARSNYAGVNGGLGDDNTTLSDNGGTFGENSGRRLADFRDGSSFAVIVGERAFFPVAGTSIGPSVLWAGTRSGVPGTQTANGAAFAVGECTTKINTKPAGPIDPLGNTGPDRTWFGFSSRHSGGAHFLIGDGAVKLISESIDMDIYMKLATIADNTRITEF